MKSIKYTLFTILLLGASYKGAKTQTYYPATFLLPDGQSWTMNIYNHTSATVNTPKGNSVSVLLFGDDWTSFQKNDMKNAILNYYDDRIIFEEEATTMYNCHAYAWGGGTTYWMNPPNQAQYWSDGSYVSITSTPPVGSKVRYVSDDHSAVTTTTVGYFSSKWGPGPQFKHLIADNPYDAKTLTYYIPRPILTVPSCLCSNLGLSVSVVLAPTGFTWNKSTNINLSDTTGTPVTAYAVGGSGTGWISVMLGNDELVKYNNISVAGSIVSGDFSDGGAWQPLYTVNWVGGNTVTAKIDYPGTNTYSWSLISSSGYVSWSGSSTILSFDMSSATAATFRVTVNRISPCTGSVTSDFNFIK